MITAFSFEKAQKAIKAAEQVISIKAPHALFVLVGVDNDYIYFNVVALHPSDGEIRDIKEKTGFVIVSEENGVLYKVECRMALCT